MNIKILGGGCSSCKKLYENTKKAVEIMGFKAQVEYITDMQRIMEYGVMRMPAVVVDEVVVSQGKVLKSAAIANLLNNAGK